MSIFIGTGTNCTRTTIEKTLLAESLGAHAALIVTPYYNKPTQEGLYQHYMEISRSCPNFPLILYNVPGRTGCDMLPETVARLSHIPNIIATKEASGKPERYAELKRTCAPGFKVLSGEDGEAVTAILEHGASGVISVTANIMPDLVAQACAAALAKKRAEAIELDRRLQPLHQALFWETSPAPVKFLLHECESRIEGHLRLPLIPVSEDIQSKLASIYKSVRQTNKGI